MKVKVLKLGHAVATVEVEVGDTIQSAIEKAGFSAEGYALTLNGVGAGPGVCVSEGDIVTLSPKAEGGV